MIYPNRAKIGAENQKTDKKIDRMTREDTRERGQETEEGQMFVWGSPIH